MLNKFIVSFIQALVCKDITWNALDNTLLRLARRVEHERSRYLKKSSVSYFVEKAINKDFPDLIVSHGLFKGMTYPETKSIGSVLYPKLLGSYELEIQSYLGNLLARKYTNIIDIGCAEGYYAVGCAKIKPDVTVYAFDIDKYARQLCNDMAKINNVSDRVIVSDLCTRETLKKLTSDGPSLIICDCEGCEAELFSDDMTSSLVGHDILVETHDFIDIGISGRIVDSFQKTHNIFTVSSIDDIKKAQTYDFDHLSGYSLRERYELLREGRPHIMEWLVMESIDKQ